MHNLALKICFIKPMFQTKNNYFTIKKCFFLFCARNESCSVVCNLNIMFSTIACTYLICMKTVLKAFGIGNFIHSKHLMCQVWWRKRSKEKYFMTLYFLNVKIIREFIFENYTTHDFPKWEKCFDFSFEKNIWARRGNISIYNWKFWLFVDVQF